MAIEICKNCKGSGVTRHDVGYHSSDWEERTCTNCKGSGKVKTRTFVYEVPFDTEDIICSKYETTIINNIRELHKITKNKS